MIQIIENIWTSRQIKKKQCNKIFRYDKLAIKVIMNCRTTSTHKFRTRLGFKQ